jgi:hypothetical protein
LSAPKKIRSPDLCAGALDDGLQRGFVQVLDDRRLQAFLVELRDVIDLDVGQAAGAVDLDEFGVAVDFAAREAGAARHAQRRDAAAGSLAGPEKTLKATSLPPHR